MTLTSKGSLVCYTNRHFIKFSRSSISSTPVVVNFKFTSIMGTKTAQSLIENLDCYKTSRGISLDNDHVTNCLLHSLPAARQSRD